MRERGQKNRRVGQTSEGRMAGNLGLDRRDALSRRHIHSDVSLHSAETVAQQAVPRRPATEQSYSEAPHTRSRRGRRARVGGVLLRSRGDGSRASPGNLR